MQINRDDRLYEDAMDAITKVFNSTCVNKAVTVESLYTLQVEISGMIDALEEQDG